MKMFFNKSELSLVNSESTNNKQANDNKVDSQLSWIIASLGQVAHFTSVVIRNVLATSGWVRSAHTAPYAKSAHNSLVKAIAFTLAETLVVMGIIGVVAALTIPNLNQSTGDREKVAKVKKIYSNIEDALGRATAVYGPMETWFENDGDDIELKSTRLAQRFQDFMKVTKDCGYGADNMSGCFLDDSALFNGSAAAMTRASSYYFTTADGTSFGMFQYGNTIWILADIDGPNKGKTVLGSDVFLFEIDFEGNFVNNESGNFERSGGGCIDWDDSLITQWVIRNDNMDYLKLSNKKCPDGEALNWETKTSCK